MAYKKSEGLVIGQQLDWSSPTHYFNQPSRAMALSNVAVIIGAIGLFAFYVLGPIVGLIFFFQDMMRGAGVIFVAFSPVVVFYLIILAMDRYYRHQKVYVYAQGLVYVWGSKRVVCPWDEIEQVWQSIVGSTVFGAQVNSAGFLSIKLQNGETCFISSGYIFDVEGLIRVVQKKVTKELLPAAQEIFDDGEILSFGDFLISTGGIGFGSKRLAWEDAVNVGIVNGHFVVTSTGFWSNWCSVPIAQIPNFFVFLALVESAYPPR